MCERVTPAAMVLPAVDEPGVEAERDVVQEETVTGPPDVDPPLAARERVERSDRVVAVEAEVARKVVAGAERHAHEPKVALDGDTRDGSERSVAVLDCLRCAD